ncbi:hypothetical protein TWF281_010091 [Arthrobotrys megalospora]
MEPDAAASRVLNTNELLEEILKHIPAQELLQNTCYVSKGWQSLIKTSPKLQWKTWQWKGTNIPPSVLQDADGALCSPNGKKYGYEFAAEAVYWLRKFWCMVLTFPRNSEEADGLPPRLCEWLIEQLPDMELFRPWLEGIHVMFEFTLNTGGVSLSVQTPGETEVDVASDKFTLRDFASLIYEKALSSQGMGLFQYAWERRGGKNSGWIQKIKRKCLLIVIVSSRAPERLGRTGISMNATFVFDFQNLETNSDRGLDVRIEYWLPGKLYHEAREEPPIFPYFAGDVVYDSDDDIGIDEDRWGD